ncbi:MAG TPA: AAA family ATPase [Acidimicrobiia bacterium]
MTAPAAVAETHVSVVFFVGDRAYKLKKPVAPGFLDFSTRELREAACHREVELNRRLAPDVYLGVADVLGPDGEPCDHLVVMRRLPADRRLSRLVTAGNDVDGELRELARLLASFHAAAARTPEIAEAATARAVHRRWHRNFVEMQPFVGTLLDPAMFEDVKALADRYIEGREDLFTGRIHADRIVDGHGDLLADDIFLLDDGPRVIDCIEFDDGLRANDVLADVAFLAMDLERLGAPRAAERFLAAYREFSGDAWPASLAHLYIAERAVVRSKVACLRADQGDAGARDQAARLLELARDHLQTGRVRLVLVGGLPGTGKSTLAAGLSGARGWTMLRSDEVRKDRAGIGHTEHVPADYGRGLYSAEQTRATYQELLARARTALARGETVILDASWTDARWRAAARAVADETATELVELRCTARPQVAAARVAARRDRGVDASDATHAVAAAMAATADPWPTARPVDTTAPPAETLAAVVRELDGIGERRTTVPSGTSDSGAHEIAV